MTHLSVTDIKSGIAINKDKMNKMLNAPSYSPGEFAKLKKETQTLQLLLR